MLVIEDSLQACDKTLNVLKTYAPLVMPDSFLIVEDSHSRHGLDYGPVPGPYEAIADFLAVNREFVVERDCEYFFTTFNPTGYLKRI